MDSEQNICKGFRVLLCTLLYRSAPWGSPARPGVPLTSDKKLPRQYREFPQIPLRRNVTLSEPHDQGTFGRTKKPELEHCYCALDFVCALQSRAVLCPLRTRPVRVYSSRLPGLWPGTVSPSLLVFEICTVWGSTAQGFAKTSSSGSGLRFSQGYGVLGKARRGDVTFVSHLSGAT